MRKTIFVDYITEFMTGSIPKINILIFALGLFSIGAMATPPLASKQEIGMFLSLIHI